MSRVSWKKLLGGVGCLVVWFVSVYVVIRGTEAFDLILAQNIALIVALFGLKMYGGIKAKDIELKYDNKEKTTNEQ
jgi:hypothetical protein